MGDFHFGTDNLSIDGSAPWAAGTEPADVRDGGAAWALCNSVRQYSGPLVPKRVGSLVKAQAIKPDGTDCPVWGASTLECQLAAVIELLDSLSGGEWLTEFLKAPDDPNDASDPCMPCIAVGSGDTVIVGPGGGGVIRRTITDQGYRVKAIFFYQDDTLHTKPFSYDPDVLSTLNQGRWPQWPISDFFSQHAMTRPAKMVFVGEETGTCFGDDCIEVVVRDIYFLGCKNQNGNVQGCNATPGCSYYHCSDQCHPTGTSNCDAGCFDQCTTCRRYDGNFSGCSSAPDCSYALCSGQCHPTGTSNCFAGCINAEERCDCRAFDNDLSACDAAPGCGFHAMTGQCRADTIVESPPCTGCPTPPPVDQ